MGPEQVAAAALELPDAVEEQPFGPQVDVFKVAGKIFAILAPDNEPPSVSLKCEPELAIDLREQYDGVTPGYHLNKKHWNTVRLDASIPDDVVAEMIEHSHRQVVRTLPKSQQARLLP